MSEVQRHNTSYVLQSEKKKVKINRKKITKFFDMLHDAYTARNGLYGEVLIETHAPQIKYYPGSTTMSHEYQSVQESLLESVVANVSNESGKNLLAPGTLEHRRWLWFATLTDRRELSERVYRGHCHIHDNHPNLYTSEIIQISEQRMVSILDPKKYKIGSPRDSAKYWLVCGKTLHEEFDGDPVNLLLLAGWSVESVYAWKKEQKKIRGYDPIPGWGKKLISLYFLYLAQLGYLLPLDAFPADVHAQAFVIQLNACMFGSSELVYTSPLAEMVRLEAILYCKKRGYNPVTLAHASWLLGSQLCVSCSKRPDALTLCPVYTMCSGRVDTSSYFVQGVWYKNSLFMNKGGSRPEFGLPGDRVLRFRKRNEKNPVQTLSLFKK
jgi:hypothetical protein